MGVVETGKLLRGMRRAKFGNGSILINGVEWPLSENNSIWIDQIQLDFDEVTAAPDTFFDSIHGSGKLSATISSVSLFAMITQAIEPRAKLLNVGLPDGFMDLEVEVPVAITSFKGSLRCALKVIECREVFVELVEAKILGVGATTLVSSVLKSINPVFDVQGFPFHARIKNVVIQGGQMKVFIDMSAGENSSPQEPSLTEKEANP